MSFLKKFAKVCKAVALYCVNQIKRFYCRLLHLDVLKHTENSWYSIKTKGRYCTLKFLVGQCQYAARILSKRIPKNSTFYSSFSKW